MAQEITRPETGKVAPPRRPDPFGAMRQEIDRVFDAFMGGRGLARLPMLGWRDEDEGMMPSIDVRESPSGYVVEAELPGMDEKNVSVTLADNILTLKGEKKSERDEKKDDYHLTERSYGSFQRSFDLGESVDPDKVKATFDKGVLTVTLAKRPDAMKEEKRIPIGKG